MHSMYTGQTFQVCIHITLTPLISTTTLRRRHCYSHFTEEKTEAPRGRDLRKFTHLINGRAGIQIEAFCSSPPSYLLMIPPPSQCKGKGGSSLPHPPCGKEARAQMRAFEPLLTYFTAQGVQGSSLPWAPSTEDTNYSLQVVYCEASVRPSMKPLSTG